jgi:hypothetical protein
VSSAGLSGVVWLEVDRKLQKRDVSPEQDPQSGCRDSLNLPAAGAGQRQHLQVAGIWSEICLSPSHQLALLSRSLEPELLAEASTTPSCVGNLLLKQRHRPTNVPVTDKLDRKRQNLWSGPLEAAALPKCPFTESHDVCHENDAHENML